MIAAYTAQLLPDAPILVGVTVTALLLLIRRENRKP